MFMLTKQTENHSNFFLYLIYGRKGKHGLRTPLNFYSVHLLHETEVLAPINSSATISSPPTAFHASQQGRTSPAS